MNDWIADQIKDHRDRLLGAFACLSMYNPPQAAEELKRTVKQDSFHGGLLNNFWYTGPDGETYLFCDQPSTTSCRRSASS